MSWPWNVLGLEGPAPLTEIRRAYAQKLKITHPEEDPEGFQQLHSAYRAACAQARNQPSPPAPPPDLSPIPPAPDKPKDWDYDLLLHQGQMEDAQSRLRKRNALRDQNRRRYQSWPQGFWRREQADGELWFQASLALRTLEWLRATGAQLPAWERFFQSDLFALVKNNPDFVFGLEDLLSNSPDLPDKIWDIIFTSYGFLRKGASVWGRFHPLFKLLLTRLETRRKQWRNIKLIPAILVSLYLVIVLCAVLSHTAHNSSTQAFLVALDSFAEEQEYPFLQGADEDSQNTYVLQFPLTGADEDVKALGELIQGLENESFRETPPEDLTLHLCHARLSFYTYTPAKEAYDPMEAQDMYEVLWQEWAGYVVMESGIAQTDAGEAYVLYWQGESTWNGEPCYLVGAAEDETSDVLVRQYYVTEDGRTIHSLPTGALETDQYSRSEEIYLDAMELTVTVLSYD